jgi:hypothetical protein
MSQSTSTTPPLSQLLAPYENQWVAIAPDYTSVVASGRTLRETAAQVPAAQRERVIFHKVLPFDAYYEPTQV